MARISYGKARHLQRCSQDGKFVVLAIDHRDNLLNELNRHAGRSITDSEFITFKRQTVSALLPHTTGLLIDPAFGIADTIYNNTLSASRGLLAPLEVTDYDRHPSKREPTFIAGWSIEQIKQVGGDGVKLLLYYHPDAPDAAAKREKVQQIVERCARLQLPFYLEPIAYTLDPAKTLSNQELLQVLIESARIFSSMGVDVLKMQFPVDAKQTEDEAEWLSACEALNAACEAPWALLSAGITYETFLRQAQIACESGASGVIVGRAVWAEAVNLQGEERQQFLTETASARMAELQKLVMSSAHPWNSRLQMTEPTPDWYLKPM